MNYYDTNQYVEIFNKLPAEIKDVVAASSTTEHLFKIGQKRNLHIDKIGIMTDIAFDVMMGIIASRNFVAELQKELGIPALDAAALARDIDENVFRPIKSTMISIYGDRAPNRPSSTLVEISETDEDHEHLDKDLLLREIESPVVAKPRVEKSVEFRAESLVSEKSPEAAKSTAIEEYHEEIKTGAVLPEVKPEIKTVEKAPEAKPIPNSLDRLAEMKLTQTFVMPKQGSVEFRAESLEQKKVPDLVTQNKTVPDTLPKSITPEKTSPATELPKPYTSDPYREPLA